MSESTDGYFFRTKINQIIVYDSIQEKNLATRAKNSQISEALKKCCEQKQSLEAKNARLSRTIEQNVSELEDVRSEMGSMKRSRDKANNLVKALRKEKTELDAEVEKLSRKLESLKLSIVRSKYKVARNDEFDVSDSDPVVDKSASKAAALELKLLRDSFSKLGYESKMLRARRDELEDLKENLQEQFCITAVLGLGTFFPDANRIDATISVFSKNNSNRIDTSRKMKMRCDAKFCFRRN